MLLSNWAPCLLGPPAGAWSWVLLLWSVFTGKSGVLEKQGELAEGRVTGRWGVAALGTVEVWGRWG